jgi:hypothetical protein
MPSSEHSAQPQRLLKVGDFETGQICLISTFPSPF